MFFPHAYLLYWKGNLPMQTNNRIYMTQFIGMLAMLVWCFIFLGAEQKLARAGLVSLLLVLLLSAFYKS